MKKLLTLTLLVLAVTFGAYAQNTVRVGDSGSGGLAYNEGDKIFQAGIGFGYYGYGFGYGSRSASLPALTASLELGLHEYFSVGPYLGYVDYNYRGFGFNWGYSVLAVGARGSFHYVPLLNEYLDLSLDEEKLDFYISLFLGLDFRSYDGADRTGFGNNAGTGFNLGSVAGFRYKFNNRFGVYFEGGRGAISYATFGVSLHF